MAKIKMRNLEIDLVDHCHLRCCNCSHQSPIKPQYFATLDEVRRDVGKMNEFVHADQFSLLGGEPLLHPQIIEIAKIIKEIEIGDRLNIDTNGILLGKQPDEFWNLMDSILLDVYPGKLTEEQINSYKEKAVKFKVDLTVNRMNQFYAQFKKEPHTEAETQKHWSQCGHKWFTRIIQHGYLYLCAESIAIPSMRDGNPSMDSHEDGIEVATLTYEKAYEFLKETPDRPHLNSCRNCLVGANPQRWEPWREATSKEDWLKQSTH